MSKQPAPKRHCPYCEDEIMAANLPFCQPCHVTTFRCPKCHKSFSRDKEVCPHCGTPVKPAAK